jgi:hypothetical protein
MSDELKRLAEITNPTNGAHTPTPWEKGYAEGEYPNIMHGGGAVIAVFAREADRDLALYFANVHPGIISLIRTVAGAFEFIARSTDDAALRQFAREHAGMASTYADLFCALGKPVIEGEGENSSGGAG